MQTVITPCPNCGKCFDFPVTGCVTFVAEFLLANSEGNCPDCGTRVVVEHVEPEPLTQVLSQEDLRQTPIVDLELSVGCRLLLTELGADTLGDLLDLGHDAVMKELSDFSPRAEELVAFFSKNEIDW